MCSLLMFKPAMSEDIDAGIIQYDQQLAVDPESRNSIIRLQNEIGVKAARVVVAAVSRKYPTYHIRGACTGAISKSGAQDIVLGLADMPGRSEVYVAGFGKTHTEFAEIERRKDLEYTDASEVSCDSSRAEFVKFAKDFYAEDHKFPGENIPDLSLVCIDIPGVPNGYQYYQYDGKTKKFIRIGAIVGD